ncbi:hypothetical protein K502DRAFT_2349 [Neoconidiobolus thromboides FSU 785]|nr:hypothetical protein K502DRAFT_2349 [Neoconidiobolus thromboides FSU 785]
MEFLFNKTYNLYRSSPLTCYFTNELETIFTASNKHRLESTIESFIQSKLETTIPVFQTYLTLELPCLQTSLFNSVNLSTEQLYDGSIRLEEIKTWSKSYSNEQGKVFLNIFV